MKTFLQNNKTLCISLFITVVLFLSLYIPFHPPGNPKNYKSDGKDIVFKYEIFGCGSLIRKIEKGGAAIYKKINLSEPESGVYEIKFTNDSDEPMNHFDGGEFWSGGIAGKYSYYMTVEVVGIEQGAPDCCSYDPAYNEKVPLVRVVKWEPTTFISILDLSLRHFLTVLILYIFIAADISLLIKCVYYLIKNRYKTHKGD